jgi:methyl-accepting chemotaxis protein
MSSLQTEKLINNTRFAFTALFLLTALTSKAGESSVQTWGGILAASAFLLLVAIVNQIFIWFKKVSTPLIYLSVTIELSLVFIVKFVLHYDDRVGYGMTIKEPATFIVYFLFIIVSALRYNKRLNLYMGIFTIVTYSLLVVLAITDGSMYFTSDVVKFFDKDTIRLSSEIPKILFLGAFVFFIIKMADFTNRNVEKLENAEKTANANFIELKNVLDTLEKAANELLARSNELTESSNQIDGVLNEHSGLLSEVQTISSEFTGIIESIRTKSNFQYKTVENNYAKIKDISNLMENINSDSSSQREKAESALKLAITNEQNIKQTISAITDMKENSKKIEEISKTISEIADKTNLLSLNAAIESARAGEHGRGFAVVADEISKLATMSIDSSKEIATIIRYTVDNIENSSRMISTLAENLDHIVRFVKENSIFMAALNEKTLSEFNDTKVLYSSSVEVDRAAKDVINLSHKQTEFVQKILDWLTKMNKLGGVVSNSLRDLQSLSLKLKERSADMKNIIDKK